MQGFGSDETGRKQEREMLFWAASGVQFTWWLSIVIDVGLAGLADSCNGRGSTGASGVTSAEAVDGESRVLKARTKQPGATSVLAAARMSLVPYYY